MTDAPHRPTRRRKAPASSSTTAPAFDTVELRHRHDGWTPEKQVAFVRALAECGCVDAACRRVGISTSAAYALRARVEAQSFRFAWDAALDQAVQRLSDAVFSRAIHGVAQPIFYKGEQVGERRRYDERLAMFLLRYRDPVRYGAWLDSCRAERAPDAAAMALARMTDQVEADAYARDAGDPMPPPLHRHTPTRYVTPDEEAAAMERAAAAQEAAAEREDARRRDAVFDDWIDTTYGSGGTRLDDDVVSTSSTSAKVSPPPPATPSRSSPGHAPPETHSPG